MENKTSPKVTAIPQCYRRCGPLTISSYHHYPHPHLVKSIMSIILQSGKYQNLPQLASNKIKHGNTAKMSYTYTLEVFLLLPVLHHLLVLHLLILHLVCTVDRVCKNNNTYLCTCVLCIVINLRNIV